MCIRDSQWAVSNHLDVVKGDVKTAFLCGGNEEGSREVYVEPTPELAAKLGISKEQLCKIEGSIYGLRNAPRRWWTRVCDTMRQQGWTQHALDECLYMLQDKTGKLIGACGVYVDDFLITGDNLSLIHISEPTRPY